MVDLDKKKKKEEDNDDDGDDEEEEEDDEDDDDDNHRPRMEPHRQSPQTDLMCNLIGVSISPEMQF